MQEANDLLEKYKRHPFANGLLPFEGAVKSLQFPFPVIYPHAEGNQRWVMYNTNTKKPAIFSHAAVFALSDHIETGNFVPHGEHKPVNVEPKFLQARANSKCMYTYVFDTFRDLSLYEGQWGLDEYMKTADGFDVGNLTRRTYLSGIEAKYRSRFWMQTPMFIRHGVDEERVPAPDHLHPWVKAADGNSKIFRANPDRPRVWVKTAEGIVPLGESGHGDLQRGDVIAVSFMVTYHKTSTYWFPQYHPVDLVVLKPSAFDGTEYRAPSLNLHSQPPPSFDESLVVESQPDEQREVLGPGAVGSSVAHGTAMEEVWTEVGAEDLPSKAGSTTQECMEVDDRKHGLAVSDRVGGVGGDINSDEEFDLVEDVAPEVVGSVEDFVELMAEDDDKKVARTGRSSRTTQKRS